MYEEHEDGSFTLHLCEWYEQGRRLVGEYETLAGFLMVMLRRVPRRTDSVSWSGFKFEVLDVDSYRIDQVMVSRLPSADSPAAP